ncbi:MAG: hypothetical protein IJH57_04730 [Mogibacterium sp.]|nr:hypothetical protein [Mogibacterium sp.]
MDFRYALLYLVVELYCAAQAAIIYTKVSDYLGARIEVSLFKRMIIMFWLFLLFEILWVLGTSGMVAMPLEYASLCKILSTLFIPFEVYFWLHFAFRRLKIKWIANPGMNIVTMLPCIIMVACYLISIKNGLVFSIAEDGSLVQGPLAALTGMVDNLYGISIIIGALTVLLRNKDTMMRWKSVRHIIFIAICTAGGILDAVLSMTPIMPMMITLSLVGLFSSLQEGQITTDYLTEMNNRREATRFIGEAIRKSSEDLPLWLIMIEIKTDNKEIEQKDIDEETIIVKAAKIISDVAYLYDAFSSRWGDDIFVMAAQGMNDIRVNDFEEGLIWRLKWELFEKGDWRSACVYSGKVKCEDKNVNLADLINTLRLSVEEK